ncbi:hypothetical protein EJ04DRAFT_135442 [Polyplosphaeria fusca]|uniref:Uncharacterized protein n=1 Tax=Polyplosphaeria fusca TaxID=682080 RepID=A0A9P4R5Y1_9PLEO|nr:hypothetical protein EJ04DRAFT_135442 [Polyplosphaeria fusca]
MSFLAPPGFNPSYGGHAMTTSVRATYFRLPGPFAGADYPPGLRCSGPEFVVPANASVPSSIPSIVVTDVDALALARAPAAAPPTKRRLIIPPEERPSKRHFIISEHVEHKALRLSALLNTFNPPSDERNIIPANMLVLFKQHPLPYGKWSILNKIADVGLDFDVDTALGILEGVSTEHIKKSFYISRRKRDFKMKKAEKSKAKQGETKEDDSKYVPEWMLRP